MANKYLFSNYALIGETLDLKQNVNLEIDQNGRIIGLSYDTISKNLEISPNRQTVLMIPGFINSHIHIGDNFAKELGFNKELKEIVAPPFGLKHKLLRQTPEDIKIKGIQNAVLEMLSNGITFFVDFREGGVEGVNLLKKALTDSSINYLALGRFMDESEMESIFDLADGVGISSYKQISSSNKKYVLSAKQKFKKIIACHCAESIRNENLINNIFNDNFVDVIIHGTKFIKKDLEKMIENNISLVLCPRCNGYFGTGFPPINEILKFKIPVSLGTDNLMVNNTDLFEEIRYFYRISRVLCRYNKEFQLTSKDLLKMVTVNAAKNFNLEHEFGSISKGRFADLFLIDLGFPNLFSSKLDSNNIYDIITQRTKSENIIKTFIKGGVVFERN
ncbi:MAG: amidohydrolase family protein [Candidatus Lokiarchaeota archaeon]|nr:amidohydrolase family protein [Candidatus Lokiarchaeota archaeon]